MEDIPGFQLYRLVHADAGAAPLIYQGYGPVKGPAGLGKGVYGSEKQYRQ
jgi:hypothetical protein